MMYKITKTFSYTMSAEVEAESLEEAKKLFEDERNHEWYEDDGGEHWLENTQYYELQVDEENEDEWWDPVDDE